MDATELVQARLHHAMSMNFFLNPTVMPVFSTQGGIQQHICDILEGGIPAFEKRKNKYHI